MLSGFEARAAFANKFAPTACGQKLGLTVCFCPKGVSIFREQVRSYGLRPEAEGSRFASARRV
ncbi:hypothetical protein CCL11_26560 [Pseudomonas syringae]|nr:hypothetical protein CCL11_26560 [Pseudomonas syringae]